VGLFLAQHHTVFAPIIEWGGLIVLLFIILSPFLIIRHPYFKPTRIWHILGAYLGSFAIYLAYTVVLSEINPWLIRNIFTSWETRHAFDQADLYLLINLLWIYPLLTFYSAYLLMQRLSLKILAVTIGCAVIMGGVLVVGTFYVMAYFIGQAFMGNF
jgi:hypothetical protein